MTIKAVKETYVVVLNTFDSILGYTVGNQMLDKIFKDI